MRNNDLKKKLIDQDWLLGFRNLTVNMDSIIMRYELILIRICVSNNLGYTIKSL